jgi:DNA-binding MarR family transcriptional regulator
MEKRELETIVLDWSTTFIRLSMHDFNRFTREANLSLAQMTVLLHLYYQGPSEVMNFCELMQISPAGASQMVERMVQQGVVERVEAPGDRRIRLVTLTETGRKLVNASIAARQAWVGELVGGLTAQESQRVVEALHLLNEHAQKLEIHP